jgi:predicted short-subunit dehydrogenase-like oxidoreductase (DUF2520 family)
MPRPRDGAAVLSAPLSAPRVFVYGAGKVGVGLARALRATGSRTTLRAARLGLPRAIDADVVIVAVRDRDVSSVAEQMAARRLVSARAVVVHVAGALDAEALAPLRGHCAGVAQMHPMIAFASSRKTPSLIRGNVRLQGDPHAVVRARALAKRLGMTPRELPSLDPIAYHAAAGLVANGAAALAAVGAELLVVAGTPRDVAPAMLGPLLRSVAENVDALGFPEALTGPVRRGDAAGLAKHLATLRALLPQAVPLYLAAAAAQLPIARAIGDATAENLDAIEAMLVTETA